MPLDPMLEKLSRASNPQARMAAQIADLQRQVAALQQSTFQVISGAPTSVPKEGAGAVDKTNVRLWLYVNGGWHYAGLT